MLLKAGADSLIKDKKGKIASKYINHLKYPDLYKLYKKAEKLEKALNAKRKSLESQRKKVSSKNINLNMYLALAINNRDIDSIVRLIQMGADINTHGLNGSTALHVALEKGKGVIAQQLVDHGASVTATDGMGNTPLKLAQKHGIIIITPHANISASDPHRPIEHVSKKPSVSVIPKPSSPKLVDVSAMIKAAHVTNIERPKAIQKTEVKKALPKPVVNDVAKDTPRVVRQPQETAPDKGGNVDRRSADSSSDMKTALRNAPRIPSASKVQNASHAKLLIPTITPFSKSKETIIIKRPTK